MALYDALASLNLYFATCPSFLSAHCVSPFLIVLDWTILKMPGEEYTQ
jgi:hypothetical protein